MRGRCRRLHPARIRWRRWCASAGRNAPLRHRSPCRRRHRCGRTAPRRRLREPRTRLRSASTCCGKAEARSSGANPIPASSSANESIRGRCAWPAKMACVNSANPAASPAEAPIATTATLEGGLETVARRAPPGWYSSTIRCALLPPKPNALNPARRISGPSHGSLRVSRRNGEAARSRMASVARATCKPAGRTRCSMAPSSFNKPAIPAAVMGWPRLDLMEPMGTSRSP